LAAIKKKSDQGGIEIDDAVEEEHEREGRNQTKVGLKCGRAAHEEVGVLEEIRPRWD